MVHNYYFDIGKNNYNLANGNGVEFIPNLLYTINASPTLHINVLVTVANAAPSAPH